MGQQQDKHDLVRNGARAHRCFSPSLRKTAHGVDSSFSPQILLIAQWIIHPSLLLPPSVLSHLFCPEFTFNTFPWSTNNNKIKKFAPISTAPRTDSSEKRRETLKSWKMSELTPCNNQGTTAINKISFGGRMDLLEKSWNCLSICDNIKRRVDQQ